MNTYKVWIVYEGSRVKYFVVNSVTRQVQSCWENWIEAKYTARDLNKVSA